MVLKHFATAAFLLLIGLLAVGCGSDPASALNDCIMEGVSTFASATDGATTHSLDCQVPMKGPYQVMMFPPRSQMDQDSLKEAESKLLAAAKVANLPGPTHESIFVIPGNGKGGLSYRQSYAPIPQLISLDKTDNKISVVLEKADGGIRIAQIE
jgi:hypothetical protein